MARLEYATCIVTDGRSVIEAAGDILSEMEARGENAKLRWTARGASPEVQVLRWTGERWERHCRIEGVA